MILVRCMFKMYINKTLWLNSCHIFVSISTQFISKQFRPNNTQTTVYYKVKVSE